MGNTKKNLGEPSCFMGDDSQELIDIDEVIFRPHKNIIIDNDAPLEKKSDQKDILKKLMRIQEEVFKKAKAKGII